MKNTHEIVRGIIDQVIDEDELYEALKEEVAARIDYSEVAEVIVDSINLNDTVVEYLSILPF